MSLRMVCASEGVRVRARVRVRVKERRSEGVCACAFASLCLCIHVSVCLFVWRGGGCKLSSLVLTSRSSIAPSVYIEQAKDVPR